MKTVSVYRVIVHDKGRDYKIAKNYCFDSIEEAVSEAKSQGFDHYSIVPVEPNSYQRAEVIAKAIKNLLYEAEENGQAERLLSERVRLSIPNWDNDFLSNGLLIEKKEDNGAWEEISLIDFSSIFLGYSDLLFDNNFPQTVQGVVESVLDYLEEEEEEVH